MTPGNKSTLTVIGLQVLSGTGPFAAAHSSAVSLRACAEVQIFYMLVFLRDEVWFSDHGQDSTEKGNAR